MQSDSRGRRHRRLFGAYIVRKKYDIGGGPWDKICRATIDVKANRRNGRVLWDLCPLAPVAEFAAKYAVDDNSVTHGQVADVSSRLLDAARDLVTGDKRDFLPSDRIGLITGNK